MGDHDTSTWVLFAYVYWMIRCRFTDKVVGGLPIPYISASFSCRSMG